MTSANTANATSARRAPRSLRRLLTDEDLARIAAAVEEAETATSGELRVHLISRLLPLENPRRRAIREFFRLGMDRTREGTGVLLFFAVRSARFEIVADRTIDERVGHDAWERLAAGITDVIHEDGLAAGLEHAVRQVGRFLSEHFPIRPDDVDELPNEVSFG